MAPNTAWRTGHRKHFAGVYCAGRSRPPIAMQLEPIQSVGQMTSIRTPSCHLFANHHCFSIKHRLVADGRCARKQVKAYLALASVFRRLCVRLRPFVFAGASICVRFAVASGIPEPFVLRPIVVFIGTAPEGWGPRGAARLGPSAPPPPPRVLIDSAPGYARANGARGTFLSLVQEDFWGVAHFWALRTPMVTPCVPFFTQIHLSFSCCALRVM